MAAVILANTLAPCPCCLWFASTLHSVGMLDELLAVKVTLVATGVVIMFT